MPMYRTAAAPFSLAVTVLHLRTNGGNLGYEAVEDLRGSGFRAMPDRKPSVAWVHC
jgi:hypothetical protein